MTTNKNSFQRLEEEELRSSSGVPPEIENNIQGNVSLVQMIGNVIELYLPRVFDMFINITGGTIERPNQKRQNVDSEDFRGSAKTDRDFNRED